MSHARSFSFSLKVPRVTSPHLHSLPQIPLETFVDWWSPYYDITLGGHKHKFYYFISYFMVGDVVQTVKYIYFFGGGGNQHPTNSFTALPFIQPGHSLLGGRLAQLHICIFSWGPCRTRQDGDHQTLHGGQSFNAEHRMVLGRPDWRDPLRADCRRVCAVFSTSLFV